MNATKRVITFSVFVLVVLLTFVPIPLPIDFPIKVTQAGSDSKIRFYYRPVGLPGLITGDNPWVYARVVDSSGERINIADVWADTPCDGVGRLSKKLLLKEIRCLD